MKPKAIAAIGIACLVLAQGIASFALKPLRAETVSAGEAITAVKPGEFAGTLLLGGFRGLACDLLWMRAMSAKDNRRFYESVALFQVIARVQPRFEQIWEYMSWDLAYNISVEVDDDDGKWSWYLAGLDANVRGCRRNPDSERLLRHLAWMFHHKGDNFHSRVLAADWAPMLNPLVEDLNVRLAEAGPLPEIPLGESMSNFQLSEFCYRAALTVAAHEGKHVPAFVRRMIPHSIEKDGNLWRNRGQHLRALERYLDSLEAWQVVRDWIAAPNVTPYDENDKSISGDVTERNEGRERRKAAELAELLAPDAETGTACALAILARDWPAARAELAKPGWKKANTRGGIIWLDEQPASEPVSEPTAAP
jgi:hypothetical protein